MLPNGWTKDVVIEMTTRQHRRGAWRQSATGAEARGRAGDPGMANVHSHAFQRAMAGLRAHGLARNSFWTGAR